MDRMKNNKDLGMFLRNVNEWYKCGEMFQMFHIYIFSYKQNLEIILEDNSLFLQG